jgi:serine/threonine protein kinase
MRSIAHFELLEKLGAGGMGEVFKARDTRLNRFVAIKLLPEAAHSAARERFQREALAIAALNHPNICTLYDAGEQDGRPYLAMELLEGETLYARLARGPVSPAQVAQWGAEIADALQAAHAKGILHRDLKPGNIFITQRGAVKVLDFGLAQFAAGPDSDSDAATVAGTAPPAPGAALPPLTTPGTALGTYAYMSPEQARGEPTDARSDLFSLGVVLYEMAGGRPPFRGRTSADVTAAILKDQPPPPSSLRPELPPKLDDIVAQCLEKDPELRFQSGADLRASLRRLQGASSSAPSSSAASPAAAPPSSASGAPASAPPAGPARRPWLIPTAAALIVIAAVLARWRLMPRAAPPVHLQFHQLTFAGNIVDAVISPDGKFLAHIDNSPQGTSLHLLSIASNSDVQIMPPAPGCCQSPSFSPDGSHVYFLDNLVLKSVPLLGGQPRTVAAHACSGAGFSPHGSRIAFVAGTGPDFNLTLARADGSDARVLHRSPPGSGYLSQCFVDNPGAPTHAPAWSPDGRRIALDLGEAGSEGYIEIVNTRTGAARRLGPSLITTASDVNWLPTGRGLVFTAAIPDSAAPQVWELSYPGGILTQLTSDLQDYTASSVSQTGQLAVVHAIPQFSIWTQAKPGGPFQQVPGGGLNQDGEAGLAWTPQGGLISVRILGNKQQLWAENPDGGNAHPLAVDHLPPYPFALNVAPNGQIVFGAGTSGNSIWRVNADGSGLTELVHPAPGASAIGAGLVLADTAVDYMYEQANGDESLWTVPLAGGTPRQAWNGFIFSFSGPPSPHGARVFVIAKTPGHPHQGMIVRVDGRQPQATPLPGYDRSTMSGPHGWTADGRAITYLDNHGTVSNIWALPIAGGPPYPLTHFTDLTIGDYAFSHDGRLAVSRGSANSDVVLATGLANKPH